MSKFPVYGIKKCVMGCWNRLTSMELTRLDRTAIQTLYGVCTGRFDGAFDWLHTNPNRHLGIDCMEPCQYVAQCNFPLSTPHPAPADPRTR